jgi:DNA-binding NtrC family response regulator
MDTLSWGMAPITPQKILIADDEYLIRWSLSQALTQEGYHVMTVENGRGAVELAKTHQFDFIIIDLIMPEMDGWEVLKHAREIQPPPRVIIITAHSKEDTGKIAKENGAWAFLEKPYLIDNIVELLKKGVIVS